MTEIQRIKEIAKETVKQFPKHKLKVVRKTLLNGVHKELTAEGVPTGNKAGQKYGLRKRLELRNETLNKSN